MSRSLSSRIFALCGGLLLIGGATGLVVALGPVWRGWLAAPHSAAPYAAAPYAVVQQPQSVKSSRVWLAAVSRTADLPGAQPRPTVEAVATVELPAGEPEVKDAWEGFFDGSHRFLMRITPPAAVGGGREIKIAFWPGAGCEYGSGQACVSRHRDGAVTLLTVHSGLGGEGEAFRSAVEGTGLDLAFYSFAQIQRNLVALAGAPVRIQAGSLGRDDLALAGVVRVPPAGVADYFARPFDESLVKAVEHTPALAELVDGGEPLLAFEICGWQIPGEAWAPEVSPTTASIYLGIIQIQDP